MRAKTIEKSSSYNKRLLPWFILFSMIFLTAMAGVLLFLSYNYALNRAEILFHETYNQWLSDLKKVRFETANTSLRYSIETGSFDAALPDRSEPGRYPVFFLDSSGMILQSENSENLKKPYNY